MSTLNRIFRHAAKEAFVQDVLLLCRQDNDLSHADACRTVAHTWIVQAGEESRPDLVFALVIGLLFYEEGGKLSLL